MRNITLSFTLLLSVFNAVSQSNEVLSGPMLGYAESKEAVVWIQLKDAGQVYAIFGLANEGEMLQRTEMVSTSANTANTAKLYFKNLKPGVTYQYRIVVNNTEQSFTYPLQFSTAPLWEYRTNPPAFTMALGSCTYINEAAADRPGQPYGADYSIFESITKQAPDAMLWLGDNIYLRPVDYWTRSGYLTRYTHTRQQPELQELLAACPNFAIWDDHDFGPNDASGSWIHKDLALEAFRLFWANHTFGYRDLPGTMSAFRFRDLDFILMDNRYNRTEQSANHPEHIFGQLQCERLIDLLKQSRAPFKMVVTGGQFLNSAKVYENHSNYEQERQYLLDRINQENIKGVVFLSGDRHHSEVSEYKLPNGNMIYEYTVSPLTSGPNKNVEEINQYQVPGSLLQVRNFAVLKMSGDLRNRILEVVFYDAKGQALFKHKVKEKSIY